MTSTSTQSSILVSWSKALPAQTPCTHASLTLIFVRAAQIASILALSLLSVRAADSVEVLHEWPETRPEKAGFSSKKLEQLWTDLQAKHTTAFLLIRHDRIIFERYAEGANRHTPHYTASMAKALVGGMCFMLAMDEDRVAPTDPASRFVPQWSQNPLKARITLAQLATHTSGIEDAEELNTPHNQLTGWKGDFWKRLEPPRDPFTLARDAAPVLDTPGTSARYSNPGMAMLGYCLTAALRGSTNADLQVWLRTRIMDSLDIPVSEWSVGYGRPIKTDNLALIATWGGGSYSPNATARIGRLLLHDGNWNGRQLLSKQVVKRATSWAGLPNHSGLGWWVNRNPDGSRFCNSLPVDAFYGAGAGHQILLVVPSLQLIVVRNGDSLDANVSFDEGLRNLLINPLMACINKPPPPSNAYHSLQWAPKDSIIRKARGSDNWPITWADDDALYTAYGDGTGFEPFLQRKLSLGLAKVCGSPESFSATNLPSKTLEQLGDGPGGRKASGLLMVDGTLYLWARNATNSQLAWSGDHGATWTWSDWRFTNSFGCPSFVNYGPNYAGAKDAFVYVLSPDSDSAYVAADRLLLARVPKDKIRDRAAYEFFQGTDSNGEAGWTSDAIAAAPVLTCAQRCYRVSVTYDAPLKRYLLVMPQPEEHSRDAQGKVDTRSSGGLLVCEAPNPWGPWHTVFFTDQWDVGPGDSASFPTKWMSVDGRTLYLVFSGDDTFSVRRAELR